MAQTSDPSTSSGQALGLQTFCLEEEWLSREVEMHAARPGAWE